MSHAALMVLRGTWHAHSTLTIAGHGHCCCLKNLAPPPCSLLPSLYWKRADSLCVTAMNVPCSLAHLQCNKPPFLIMALTHHMNWTQFLDITLGQEEENSPVNGIWEIISTVYFAECWECLLNDNFYCDLFL